MIRRPPTVASLLLALGLAACGAEQEPAATGGEEGVGETAASPLAEHCAPNDDGLTLPDGFCAILVHEGVGPARHIEVAENGDLFVALRDRRESRGGPVVPGGVAVLRDTDGDARPDTIARFGEMGGNDVLLRDGWLWFAPNDRVLRYPMDEGAMEPSGPAETVVSGLPDTQNHTAKSIALRGSDLFVNIGSPSNACMQESRTPGSPGMDPCPELDTRAGIWRFDATATGQTQADGTRFATGIRNAVALAVDPADDGLYAVIHGRDQLHGMYPERYTVDQNTEKPAEEMVRVDEGTDVGWPYCYHDPATGEKLLAPEYGGDGTEVGRCAEKDMPLVAFPAHWAPNDLTFYDADQFPARYRGGAFVAFHGSWNRAPNPQEGFRVAFVPSSGGSFGPDFETFADGFRNEGDADAAYTARPVGLAVGPDGSLWVSESVQGRIWRIVRSGG